MKTSLFLFIGLVAFAIGGNSLKAVSVTVSYPQQPAATIAPEGAARLPFTFVNLRAGHDASVLIEGIEVQKTGSLPSSAYTGVMILDQQGLQIGPSQQLHHTGAVVTGTAFVIPAGESRTVTIAANITDDLSEFAGKLGGFVVTKIYTSAVVRYVPINGQHTANRTLAIGSVNKNWSFDNGLDQEKFMGTKAYNFASIGAKVEGENMLLKAVRWRQSGSARQSDIDNVETVVNGVGYSTTVTGSYYTTVFPPEVILPKGKVTYITIRGDIIDGLEKTVVFDIESREDIYLVGDIYGFGVLPPDRGFAIPYYNGRVTTIIDEVVTDPVPEPDPTGILDVRPDPAIIDQNVSVGVIDQLIAGFTVTVANEAVTVREIFFPLSLSGENLNAGDIVQAYITYEDGTIFAGPVDGSETGGLLFTDVTTFPKGTTHMLLRGKLSNNFIDGDTFSINTIPSEFFRDARGENTGHRIIPSPNTIILGAKMTARRASLDVIVSSQLVSERVVVGSSQSTVATYFFDTTRSSEDVHIKWIPLSLRFSGIDVTDITGCRLFDGNSPITEVLHPNSISGDSETFIFREGGYRFAKGTITEFSLRCDVSSRAQSGTMLWTIDESLAGGNYSGAYGVLSAQTIINSTFSIQAEKTVSVMEVGSHTVTADTSLEYQMVQAGLANVNLAGFYVTAGAAEDIELRQVALELGETQLNSPLDLFGEGVTLWHGGVQVGTAQFGGADPDHAVSSLISPVRVGRGERVLITVKGDLTAQNNTSGTPGAFLVVKYDGDRNGLDGNYAVGVDSGVTIPGTSGDVTTTGVRIFRNVPTIEVQGQSRFNAVVGSDTYAFTVENSGSRDIEFQKFTIEVGTVGQVDDLTLYGDGIAFNAVPASPENGFVEFFADPNSQARTVSAGSSKTYVLKVGSVSGRTEGSEGLIVGFRLVADQIFPNAVSHMGTVAEIEGGEENANNIIWSPHSTSNPLGASEPDWTNSYGMPVSPEDSPSQTWLFSTPVIDPVVDPIIDDEEPEEVRIEIQISKYGSPTLTFNTRPSRQYNLQAKMSLSQKTWQDVESVTTTTGPAQRQIFHLVGNQATPRRFFRVVTPQ